MLFFYHTVACRGEHRVSALQMIDGSVNYYRQAPFLYLKILIMLAKGVY